MPQTQPRPAVLAGRAIGQAVGQVESFRARLLAEVLAQAGTKRETYLALQRLDALGAAAVDDSVRDLVDWLDLDLWSAGELAKGLAGAGLLTSVTGTVQIAAEHAAPARPSVDVRPDGGGRS